MVGIGERAEAIMAYVNKHTLIGIFYAQLLEFSCQSLVLYTLEVQVVFGVYLKVLRPLLL